MTRVETTNAMITYVADRFGTSSNEAVYMRSMVRAFILNRGVKYEDCLKVYKFLMKKKEVYKNEGKIRK